MAGTDEGSVNVWAAPLSFCLVFPDRIDTALPGFSSIFGRNLGKQLFILFANKMLLVSGKVSEHRGGAGPRSTEAGRMDVAHREWRETGSPVGTAVLAVYSLFPREQLGPGEVSHTRFLTLRGRAVGGAG